MMLSKYIGPLSTPRVIRMIICSILMHSTVGRAIRTEEDSEVLDQSLRLLPGSKVSTFLLLFLKDDVAQLPVPNARRPSDLPEEV